MRISIIDIGTNTINLLVADVNTERGTYTIVHSSKVTARLGKDGINNSCLTPEAMQRGLDAIEQHMKTLSTFGTIDRIVAIGTSALRVAENRDEFINQVRDKFNIEVRVISGDDEARMIFDGVKQVFPISRERVLILDIGGGSCEFIIANRDGIIWEHSYEVGMARLIDKFQPSDPITPQQIKNIEAHLRNNMMSLYEALHNYPTTTLVGTSGSFDTMAAIVAGKNHPYLNVRLSTSYEIPIYNFDETYRKIINSNTQQRLEMKGMDTARADLIVPGVIFINFVLTELRMERLFQCGFALKQGAIYQLVNNI